LLKEWEFQKLYHTASPHFKPIVLYAYTTGMRKGEILKLRWEMGLTGHKDIRMLKRYSHTREEAKKAAIEKLGRRLKRFSMDTSEVKNRLRAPIRILLAY
jgi:hypothetical protein